MKFWAELSARLLFRDGLKSLGLTGWISFAGLVIGVACLVVSMAVVSGFESTLQRAVSDLTGHLQVLKPQGVSDSDGDLHAKLQQLEPDTVASTRVLWVESVAAAKGKISGALLQGLDPERWQQVLALDRRVIAGHFDLGSEGGIARAMIGKGLAKKFELQPGDTFRVVVPLANDYDPNTFKRKVATFRVAGILDLGKYEFDERLIVSSMAAVQEVSGVGTRYSGLLVRLKDYTKARESAGRLSLAMGPGFRVRDWHELNENIFEAIKIERVVLFFVILIIVLAAAFNVASSLYISVIQRYPDIGIFKAIGMSPRDLIKVFSFQGLILGLAGCLTGFALGGVLGLAFMLGQNLFTLLPGSVYKLDHIDLVFRFWDLFAIFSVTMIICGLATLAPARQGARLSAVEGLRYE
ncbi:MAG: ABC transporter permease [Bdellovibrionaceae bacterium]|nr:ABC transporter permease [Pseudobdellovibrionaceae bacterium]